MPAFVASYVHNEGRLGALVRLKHRESTSARTSQLQELACELAMQVVAMRPLVIAPRELDEDAWRQQLSELRGSSKMKGAAADRLGQLNAARQAFERTSCLLKQPFIKDQEITVEERVRQVEEQLSEEIEVVRFTLFDTAEVE